MRNLWSQILYKTFLRLPPARRLPTQPAVCVAFPRSGYYRLMRMLALYYEGALSETYFRKESDSDLKLLQNPTCRYVVQTRNPLEAIVSWYASEMEREEDTADSRRVWEKFAREKVRFWNYFCDKWVTKQTFGADRIQVRYEQLLDEPVETVAGVIRFLSPA